MTEKLLSKRDAKVALVVAVLMSLATTPLVREGMSGGPFAIVYIDWGIAVCIAAMLTFPIVGYGLFICGRFSEEPENK